MTKAIKAFGRMCKKSLSLVLATSMLFSVGVLSGISLGVSAATSAGQNIYLNVSQNSTWDSLSTINARFVDDGGVVKGENQNISNVGGVFKLNAPSGATRIEVTSNSMPKPSTAVAKGKNRVFLNASSVNGVRFTNPYIHYYASPTQSSSTWPGAKMNSLGNDYYYYDIDESYKGIVFSNNGENQTADQTINLSYSDHIAYFNGKNWVNPYIKMVDVSNIPNKDTEIYLLSDGTFKTSKYISTVSDQSTIVRFNTVYVLNDNWSSLNQVYATYDFSDPYRNTVTLSKDSVNGRTVFKGKIPDGASVRFHPNADNLNGASSVEPYPEGSGYDKTGYSENTATYKMSVSSEYWCKMSEIDSTKYDAVIPNRFSENENIIGVDATYFDYLSDEERSGGYLNNTWNDISGYDSHANAMWFPFSDFNRFISGVASIKPTWELPLYFGNLYREGNKYGYSSEVSGLTQYYGDDYRYAVNNSNGLKDMHQSVQGLAFSKLDSNGDLQAADGVKMPYFDANTLSTATYHDSRVAKVFKSSFPFRSSTNSAGVTTYSFDSTGAKDNVYFTWDGTTPKYVNYGAGSNYGVNDAATAFGNTSNGYGIFPFNNTPATKTQNITDDTGRTVTYTRGGNDNLDYGFGVRLDIDFRVPRNGTVDGTSSGEAVSFNYTGDDDLWVYIGEKENGADSELVLDLGGDHKQAVGSIDFKTMTATANNVYANFGKAEEVTVPTDEFWVKTGDYVDFCVYTWGSQTKYVKPYTTSDGYYKFKKSDFGSNTGAIFCKWQNISDGKLSNDLTLANLYGKSWNGDGKSAGSSIPIDIGKQTKTFNNGQRLDPNKIYHMTVFYMERGLVESNFSVGFTMTPASNNLKVNKALDTGDVVSAIANDLRKNEEYYYTISDGNSGSTFILKDTETKEFNNTYKTESNMTVNESLINSALRYDTSWTLIDNKLGSTISTGDGTRSSFVLVDPNVKNSYAQLELDYVNKIKTAPLSITKRVVDVDGTTDYDTNQEFKFRLSFDLDGYDSMYNFKGYPVEYMVGDEVYRATSDGVFGISKDETVTFINLPVGASFKLEEYTATGYRPYKIKLADGSVRDFSGVVSKSIIEGGSSFEITNIVTPSSTKIDILKTLDGKNYGGSKFVYTISGLGSMQTQYDDPQKPGQKLNSESTAGRTQSVTTPKNGTVTFDDANVLKFVSEGYYRYKITESFASGVTDAEKQDFSMDTHTLFVEIYVNADGEPDEPTFYSVTSTELSDITSDSAYAQFFTDSYKVNTAKFENTTTKGKITVNKQNQSGDKLDQTVFGLVKVSSKDILADSDITAIINADQHIIKATTDTSGVASFENLVIFKDGQGEFVKNGNAAAWSTTSDDYISGSDSKQTYCLFEYSPKTGYNPSYVKYYITLPQEGEYDVTCGYVDGAVTMPDASGSGMNLFIILGIGIIGTAVLLCGTYLIYDAKQKKKRRARCRTRRY